MFSVWTVSALKAQLSVCSMFHCLTCYRPDLLCYSDLMLSVGKLAQKYICDCVMCGFIKCGLESSCMSRSWSQTTQVGPLRQRDSFISGHIMFLICVQYISINSSHLAVNHLFPDPFLSGPGTPSHTFFVNLKRTITSPEPVYDHVNFGYALRKVFFSHSA